MKVRSKLSKIFHAVIDEAERNPDFERRIAVALGMDHVTATNDQSSSNHPKRLSGQRPKNRRPPPVLDPVEIAKSGENVLRERLATLSIEQLKDIVADFGMDPGKLVIKWKSTDRIIDRIVEISLPRSQKGNAFRSEPGGANQ